MIEDSMSRPIQVGDRVKRTYDLNGEDSKTEVGVVVHIWRDSETDVDDAYIAIFGGKFPDGKPAEKPEIFRYFLDGLELLDS